MNDKISILLPTRNRAQMLKERAIPTVLGQTYKNWELLIVGDACTNETEQIVRSFNDPRIKYFNLPEKIYHYPKDDPKAEWLAGPVMVLNKALDMVTGDYIARLDDDDLWLDRHLERSLDLLYAEKADFISWRAIGVNNGSAWLLWEYPLPVPNGSVQTWVYSAKYKDLKYDPDCWKKEINRNNEIDWFERFYKLNPKIIFQTDIHALILPRPGLTTIGSRAYITEKGK